MKRFIERIATFFLTIFIVVIFTVTTYFCLEFFDIITVPEKYSLVKIINSKMEMMVSVQEYIPISTEDSEILEIEDEVEDSIIVELEGNSVTTIHLSNLNEEQIETFGESYFRYYDQLNEYSKKMYDALEREKEMLRTGTYTFDFGTEFDDLLKKENGSEILNNSFQLAVNAFSFDHPEIFYIDITKMYLLTEITTRAFSKTYRVSIGKNETDYLYEGYQSQADVELAIEQAELIKENVKQNAFGSDYDKVKYVHDYLIETIEYEKTVESHNNYNIYGALINKKSVCEGYAKAFKYILDDMEIPCIVVFGTAKNSSGQIESHAWNYVKLNNEWYAIDVTWDDPIIIGFGYLSNDIKYKYFLKGQNNFFSDHTEDGTIVRAGTFIYPNLSETDY